MTKVAIVGSRSYVDSPLEDKIKERVLAHVGKLNRTYDELKIISGGADGPDSWAEKGARHFRNSCKVIEPDWDEHGKAAGLVRNSKIVDESDKVIAFWDGESNGTKDTINKAIDRGMAVNIYVLPHNE